MLRPIPQQDELSPSKRLKQHGKGTAKFLIIMVHLTEEQDPVGIVGRSFFWGAYVLAHQAEALRGTEKLQFVD